METAVWKQIVLPKLELKKSRNGKGGIDMVRGALVGKIETSIPWQRCPRQPPAQCMTEQALQPPAVGSKSTRIHHVETTDLTPTVYLSGLSKPNTRLGPKHLVNEGAY